MENHSPVFDSDTLQIDKYEPHKGANGKNDATLFVASDDIDMADLQRYRQQTQTQTQCLIAILDSETARNVNSNLSVLKNDRGEALERAGGIQLAFHCNCIARTALRLVGVHIPMITRLG